LPERTSRKKLNRSPELKVKGESVGLALDFRFCRKLFFVALITGFAVADFEAN
jgi:hypothetical protein